MTVHVEVAPLTWLLVGDDTHVRIFSYGSKTGPWVLAHEFSMNGKGELHDAVTQTSLPGHHEPPTTPHRLGHELVHYLDKRHQARDFTQLVFVTPPHLLGFLRGHVSSTLEHAVVLGLAKEYSHFPEAQLREHLMAALPV